MLTALAVTHHTYKQPLTHSSLAGSFTSHLPMACQLEVGRCTHLARLHSHRALLLMYVQSHCATALHTAGGVTQLCALLHLLAILLCNCLVMQRARGVEGGPCVREKVTWCCGCLCMSVVCVCTGKRPQRSLAAYGAYLRSLPSANEQGLRALIGAAVREGAARGVTLTPLFSLYSYHGPVSESAGAHSRARSPQVGRGAGRGERERERERERDGCKSASKQNSGVLPDATFEKRVPVGISSTVAVADVATCVPARALCAAACYTT
jgi:hypothetical protein